MISKRWWKWYDAIERKKAEDRVGQGPFLGYR
jgi:hypothetical protein